MRDMSTQRVYVREARGAGRVWNRGGGRLVRSGWLASALVILGSVPMAGLARAATFDHPVWSPTGRYLALSDGQRSDVCLFDTQAGTLLRVAASPSSGYAYHFSPGGDRLGFKLFGELGDALFPTQIPVVFDIKQGKLIHLCGPVRRAGVPSFSRDGRIAYTVDRTLRLVDSAGRLLKTFELGHYANLAPISPDGAYVVYNDRDDRIRLLDLEAGKCRGLTPPGVACFGPTWSPDSRRLAVQTLTGRVLVVDIRTGQVVDLGQGGSPSWSADGNAVTYAYTERQDGYKVTRCEVHMCRWDGSERTRLVADRPELRLKTAALSPDGGALAGVNLADGAVMKVTLASLENASASGEKEDHVVGVEPMLPAETVAVDFDGAIEVCGSGQDEQASAPAAQVLLSGTVPYIHQVYDSPDWFNGHWACNATSALMGINYYSILPHWDCTCSTPWTHTSHYGRYIAEVYSHNGYTYNISSPDPNGTASYGGYGYIVRNNWLDTKGYMRDYFVQHGLESSVDWSPTWAELQAEVNNDYPCVVLTSLTTAGHYILTVGYFDAQHTAVFYDPYGNKNNGYMNYYGQGVYYDWPGYNNGYANLTTVHCFIYCRGNLNPGVNDAAVVTSSIPDLMIEGQSQDVRVIMENTGTTSWTAGNNYNLGAVGDSDPFRYTNRVPLEAGDSVVPGQQKTFLFTLAGLPAVGTHTTDWQMVQESVEWFGGAHTRSVEVIPTPLVGLADDFDDYGDQAAFEAAWTDTGASEYVLDTVNAADAGHSVQLVSPSANFLGRYYRNLSQTVNGSDDEPVVFMFQMYLDPAGADTDWYGARHYVELRGYSGGGYASGDLDNLIAFGLYNASDDTFDTTRYQGRVTGGANWVTLDEGTPARSGGWHNFKVIIDSANVHFYVDDVLAESEARPNTAGFNCVVIGSDFTANGHTCWLDRLNVWVRVEPPVVTQHPASQSIVPGNDLILTVGSTGGGASWQWQKGGNPLANGGRISGATASALQVSSVSYVDAGSYRCVISNPRGQATSNDAVVTLDLTAPGDFNGDADVDQSDFGLFQQCLSGADVAETSPACALARFDEDDDVDATDVSRFVGCLSGVNVPADPNCNTP